MAHTENNIKPYITNNEIRKILHKHYGLKGGYFTQLHGYDDLNYHFLPKYSCNPFIETLWPYGYVLKIMNSLDSKKNDLAEAQNALMFYLREHNITSTIPVQNMRGDYYFREVLPETLFRKKKEHIIRLLEFQPGVVLRKVIISYSLLYKLGVYLAKLNEVLKEFSHPLYKEHSSIWHLASAPEINFMTQQVLQNDKRKELVDKVIKKFIQDVLAKTETFEKGMIHGDFNEHNVIISSERRDDSEVSAILDFGDAHYSYYLFELAVALCYMMLDCKRKNMNPVIGAGHVLAGYLKTRPTFSPDLGLLKLSICARLCQSLTLGLKAFSHCPENNYVMDSQEMGWPLLEELWEISDAKITQDWLSVIQLYSTDNKEDQ